MTDENPILLITGAAKRIGRHIALEMSKSGWHIALHYNGSKEEATSLQAEIKANGANAALLNADLSDPNAAANLINRCCEQLGTPSLLINNASRFADDTIDNLTAAGFDKHFAINLRAPLLLSQCFATALGEDVKGNIINITDQRIQNLRPTFYTYTLSKVGLSAATITMAQALAPNIRVNAIAPGPVLQSIHQTKEQFTEECLATPLKIGATPADIVNTIQFILNSPALTGETITVDGGQHLS